MSEGSRQQLCLNLDLLGAVLDCLRDGCLTPGVTTAGVCEGEGAGAFISVLKGKGGGVSAFQLLSRSTVVWGSR